MEEQKPKSIKIIGLILTIFSGLLIFSNGMCAIVFKLIGIGNDINQANSNTATLFIKNIPNHGQLN